jgi:multiple sugar transport system permease protein
VRILEPAADLNKLVDLPGDAVSERSWVSLQWNNYPDTWGKLPFGRSFVNTSLVTVCVTLGQVLTCSLAAFAFARLRFPGRDKLFFGYLATMMIPGAVTLIPVYILFIKIPELLNFVFHTTWFSQDLYFLGKYYVGRLVGGNSYFALIAPGLFSAYGTFMLRQFFMTLPRALEDAARVDGCGNLRIYWHVTLPLSKVAIATLATFTFMGAWKAFMWPLLILNTEELVPLQVLLQRFQGQYGAEYNLLMAGSVIVLLPLLVVFLLGQRYFVRGIQLGAVKG